MTEKKLTLVDEVLTFWKEFDIESKRDTFEENALQIREYKSASITGRKKLNESTKEFRLISANGPVDAATVNQLLQAYQEECDQLSRRSKYCESAYMSLYKSIYAAPDPVPAIESLLHSLSSSSLNLLDIEKLKNEISQYEKEFQSLKNQDITIRRLEEQINDFKTKIEDKILEEVSKRVIEIDENAEKRIANIYELQKAAEKRLALATESVQLFI